MNAIDHIPGIVQRLYDLVAEGVKGGKARAAKPSATKRKEIAKEAAKARWAKGAGRS